MLYNTTTIQLYEILRQKLGNQEAEALVKFIEMKLNKPDEELKAVNDIEKRNRYLLRWVYAFYAITFALIIGLYFRS